jgi:hypothetical protein
LGDEKEGEVVGIKGCESDCELLGRSSGDSDFGWLYAEGRVGRVVSPCICGSIKKTILKCEDEDRKQKTGINV